MRRSISQRKFASAFSLFMLAGFALPIATYANTNTDLFLNSVIDTYCSNIQNMQTPAGAATANDAYFACSDYYNTSENGTAGTPSTNPFLALVSDITPDETPAMYTSLVQLSTDQISNVLQHLRNHRYLKNQNDADADTAYFNGMQDYIGGAAGDTVQMGRLSFFVDGSRVDGNQDDTQNEVGYDLTTDHYTLGLDYRFSDAFIAGIAYGYSDTSLDYSQGSNQTDNTTDHFIVYGSWYRDNFAVDGMLGYATGSFDTTRNINGGGTLYHANGSTDNSLTYFSLNGNYDFIDGGWTYGPSASFDLLDGSIDAFTETGNSGWEVSFDKQNVKSQIFSMGGHASYAASFGWGVLIPQFRAQWRTELEDSRNLIVGRFVQDPTTSFSITPDHPDSDWYQVAVGASAQFAHGIAAFLDYEQVLSYANTDLATVTLGARWEM